MDALERLRQSPLPFASLLGIHFTSASPDRVTAELLVREELCTRPAILHGGAILAFADTPGSRCDGAEPRSRCQHDHD
jgi:acyl-coenzyme A thioesterase PaaI-like protein